MTASYVKYICAALKSAWGALKLSTVLCLQFRSRMDHIKSKICMSGLKCNIILTMIQLDLTQEENERMLVVLL